MERKACPAENVFLKAMWYLENQQILFIFCIIQTKINLSTSVFIFSTIS